MTPYATSTQNKSARLGMSDFDLTLGASDCMNPAENHGGSRKRLMFIRKQRVIEGNQSKLDFSDSLKPHVNTRRANLITNTEIENGR